MDGEKFDDIIKRLFTIRLTRGNTLRGLAAGAAAALTGATLAEDETDAKGKHHKSGHAAHKDGGGGGHKGNNKNKHHKDNHQADAAGKHGKKKKKKNGSQTASVPPGGCGQGSKVCHCTPSTSNSVCNRTGDGNGH